MEKRPVSYMEIDLGRLKENAAKIKRSIPSSVGVIGVAKCDGYGLGIEKVTETLFSASCEKVAVSTPAEISTLRQYGISSPLLLLYPPCFQDIPSLVSFSAELTVDDIGDVEEIARCSQKKGEKTRIHVMVDTGMHRFGLQPSDVLPFVQRCKELEYISVEGMCTHFSTATRSVPDPSIYDHEYGAFAVEQFEVFMECVKRLSENGCTIPSLHVANSAAMIGYPDTVNPRIYTAFMPDTRLHIRPGGILYGLYQDIQSSSQCKTTSVLKRVVTQVQSVTEVEKGDSVGYGKRWVSPEKKTIVTIPMGFADQGYLVRSTVPEPLGKDPTHILIQGKRRPIIGLVASSNCSIDVGDMKVQRGEEVVLIGNQGNEYISLDEVAEKNSLISMQVQTLIGAKMEKVYVS